MTVNAVRKSRFPLTAVLAVAVLSLVPAGVMLKWPELNNGLTGYLLNVLLMMIPIGIAAVQSRHDTEVAAERAQNEGTRIEKEKWLPKAESACIRLHAIRADALSLCEHLRKGCGQFEALLSELPADKRPLVSMLFSNQCDRSLAAVTSLIKHTEGAINDWERYIEQTCTAGECGRIFENIQKMAQSLSPTCSPASLNSEAVPASFASLQAALSGTPAPELDLGDMAP